jgi:hypothetical protein
VARSSKKLKQTGAKYEPTSAQKTHIHNLQENTNNTLSQTSNSSAPFFGRKRLHFDKK